MSTHTTDSLVSESSPALTANDSIQVALGLFQEHMRDEGFAINTSKAFASDVRLLGKYLDMSQPIGKIGTKDLNDFLDWLLKDRGVPCSPKSYARRVTTLKVFFGWLHKIGVLTHNPADAVIQKSVKSPLPTPPSEADLAKALTVTEDIRQGVGIKKADARPHLLLTLLIKTGIKKNEAMSLTTEHVDTSDPDKPILFVRYVNPRLRYKERKVQIEPEWLQVLDEYLLQYQPKDTIFTCTARNLEYILRDIGEEAGLDKGLLSFENLRWASVLRDWRDNVEQDDIRQKLGISKITWRETKSKLEQLAKNEIPSEQ